MGGGVLCDLGFPDPIAHFRSTQTLGAHIRAQLRDPSLTTRLVPLLTPYTDTSLISTLLCRWAAIAYFLR